MLKSMGGSRTAPTLVVWLVCVLAAAAQNPPRQARSVPANLPDVNPYSSCLLYTSDAADE